MSPCVLILFYNSLSLRSQNSLVIRVFCPAIALRILLVFLSACEPRLLVYWHTANWSAASAYALWSISSAWFWEANNVEAEWLAAACDCKALVWLAIASLFSQQQLHNC